MVIFALATVAIALVAWPPGAEAHLVTTGLGPVYDGLLHFAVAPEDLIPVLALALLAGLRGPAHGRWALLVLPAAWLVGGWFGLAAHSGGGPVLPAISLIVLGVLVAADAPLPVVATMGLALALGLWRGYVNGTAMAVPGPGGVGLVGVAVGVFALVAIIASLVVSLKAAWTRIVVRVAGSWITAIGLLLLGWGLRSKS